MDRETMSYLGNDRHINHTLLEKEALLRDRSRSEMLMRQNEMLSRQHNVMVEPKHYMPNSSISLENASELLGEIYYFFIDFFLLQFRHGWFLWYK